MEPTYRKSWDGNLLMMSDLTLVFHTYKGWDLLIIVTTALTCEDILHEILYPESYTAGVK